MTCQPLHHLVVVIPDDPHLLQRPPLHHQTLRHHAGCWGEKGNHQFVPSRRLAALPMVPTTRAAQMLAVSVNENQVDLEIVLPHIDSVDNNTVSQATGLDPNEVHIGCHPRHLISLFLPLNVGGQDSLDRDQLEYCNLAVHIQRHAYSVVRDYISIAVLALSVITPRSSRPFYNLPMASWLGYNNAAIIRRGAKKNTYDLVLKADFSLSWTGPFKIVNLGPAAASDAPGGRPLERKLLHLDHSTDAQGQASHRRVRG